MFGCGCETCLVTPSDLRVFGMPRNPRKKERLENFGEPRASAARVLRHFGNWQAHKRSKKQRPLNRSYRGLRKSPQRRRYLHSEKPIKRQMEVCGNDVCLCVYVCMGIMEK